VPACGCDPILVVPDELSPSSIALDATAVYWTGGVAGSADRRLVRTPLDGSPSTVIATEQRLGSIAVSSTSIFWFSESFEGDHLLRVAPLHGGPATTLRTLGLHQGMTGLPHDLKADDRYVYWAFHAADGGGGRSVVYRMAVEGGDPVVLSDTPSAGVMELAVSATHVYWLGGTAGDAAVLKVPIEGGPATPVASVGSSWARGIAVDRELVYWTQFEGEGSPEYRSVVMRAPLAGGVATEVTSRRAPSHMIASTGPSLYWGTASTSTTVPGGSESDGAILRTSPDGSATAVIAEGLVPMNIAANGDVVCWTAGHWITFGGRGWVACVLPCAGETCEP
jgi:hypothetical protein